MKTSKTLSFFRKISLTASLLALSACTIAPSRPNSSASENDSSSSGVTDTSEASSLPSEETSEESSEVSVDTREPATFKFYCVNDFHGSIVSQGYEAGIGNLFSFLHDEKAKDPEHTFVFSAGDMFQGSWESNSNHGLCITECMNAVPFDAMALGNHDFDYGLEAQQKFIDMADFPVLAGNILDYKTGVSWGRTEGSFMVERDGYKIGIIGNIGAGQTTSIQSRIVNDLRFSSPQDAIKTEATKLKKNGADIVVSILHDAVSALRAGFGSANLKDYIDGSFHGHNHYTESDEINGVPLVNGGYNGRAYSYFELTIDNGVVTASNAKYHYAPTSYGSNSEINAILDKYLDDEFQKKTNEVLGNLSGGNLDNYGVARLGVKAIYERYKGKYPELVATIENSQRATLYTGQVTYGDLYKATPFMNEIVFAYVTGKEIKSQSSFGACYTGDTGTYGTLNDNDYYLAGIIDYLYFHQDENKIYNYFRSASDSNNVVGIENAYPVDITADYIKENLKGVITSTDFSGVNNGFNIY